MEAGQEHATIVAMEAHREQTDRAGEPYINHPLHVAEAMDGAVKRTVAILHDVVEDSEWTIDDLRQEGFSVEVVEAVAALTRSEEESYQGYITRVSKNNLAVKVKIADLMHNLDASRLTRIRGGDVTRMERYIIALRTLRSLDAPEV